MLAEFNSAAFLSLKTVIMDIKSFLKVFFVFTALWVLIVLTQIFQHYAPLLKQSNFIYNPMINARKLLTDNSTNMETLKRSFTLGEYNIYSFGIPGTVEIAISKQRSPDGHLEVWMPVGSSLASVRDDSSQWFEFKKKLTEDAVSLRKSNVRETYHQYLLKDALLIFCAPSMLVLGFIAARLVRQSKGSEPGA